MHYINDYRARDELMAHLPTSLNYQEMSKFSHSRTAFAAHIMNNKATGYRINYFDKIDILENRSMWPTLCVLKSSDNSTSHAVTVVENYIFDSNVSYALLLDQKNLDWCCSDSYCEETFIEVHSAYRFEKLKAKPEYVLRSNDQRLFGINSFIRAIAYLPDEVWKDLAVKELEKVKQTMQPNTCILTDVRERMKSKLLGYRPVSLKSLNDVLLNASSKWPSMLLLHAPGSFYYSVVSTISNLLFDGSRGPSIDLTLRNLSYAVNPEQSHKEDKSSIQIIVGYRFVKDKVKGTKKRKVDDRDDKTKQI
jgi:hypothetical protein